MIVAFDKLSNRFSDVNFTEEKLKKKIFWSSTASAPSNKQYGPVDCLLKLLFAQLNIIMKIGVNWCELMQIDVSLFTYYL